MTIEEIGNKKIPNKDTKQKRINILAWSLGVVFSVWLATEYIIAFKIWNIDTQSIRIFPNNLPFFLTTILGVIIGSSIEK